MAMAALAAPLCLVSPAQGSTGGTHQAALERESQDWTLGHGAASKQLLQGEESGPEYPSWSVLCGRTLPCWLVVVYFCV